MAQHGTSAPRPAAGEADERLDPALLRLGWVLVLGAVLSQLDTTIVTVGIGPMARALGTTVGTLQWVSTGYLLTVAFAAPLSGWLTSRFGGRRVWLAAVAGFTLASALCGLSWSPGALIAFRLLQGIGGGLMLPVGQALVARHAGPRRIGRLIGIITVPVSLAPICGPVLGGALVGSLGWRWLFLVNLPIGLAAIALALRFVPADPAPAGRPPRPDLMGLALLPPGLAGLVYGLAQAGSGGLDAPAVVALVVGVVLLLGYVGHALRTSVTPLLDLKLFAGRGFALAGMNTFLIGASLYASMLVLPLYLVQVRGLSSPAAGAVLAAQALGTAAVTTWAGRLTDRHGPRAVVLAGIGLTILGTVPFVLPGGGPGWVLVAVALFVRGLGLGTVVPANVASTYTSVPRERAPAATSARTVLNRIGGSVGTAVLTVVLTDALGTPGVAPADAFTRTFWWVLALGVLTLLPAVLYPRRGPS